MTIPPKSLFFNTFDQRIALARQRYFEDGVPPSGFVNNAIFESWARCLRLGVDPRKRVEFNHVTPSRAQLARQKNQPLIDAWSAEADTLEKYFSGTSCSAVLTDETGVLIACVGPGSSRQDITKVAHRIGVSLAEEAVGTTAPALALKTGQVITVRGGEHFFDSINSMYCAAAPIRNTQGKVAGVLNIAREGKPFDFHAEALVSMYAASIENRFLASEANEHIVVRMQLSPSLLDTPLVALMGLSYSGKVSWVNQSAAQLIGPSGRNELGLQPCVEDILGADLDSLVAKLGKQPQTIRLPNGLTVWVQLSISTIGASDTRVALAKASRCAEAEAEVEVDVDAAPIDEKATLASKKSHTSPNPSEPLDPDFGSLLEFDTDFVLSTVQSVGGNISKAARKLNVSRGLIYRRLKAAKSL